MPKTKNTEDNFSKLRQAIYQIFDIVREEKTFIILTGVLFFIAGVVYPYPGVAMWFGFLLASYSAVSNDSIQTIGTFIASNADRKWYVLWLYIGLIFLVTVTISWFIYDGDVSFQRLNTMQSDGTLSFPQPDNFNFLQIAAPIFLLILTRLRMPVSTTFLLLSSFAASPGAVGSVIAKSLDAYVIAFILGFAVWVSITRFTQKHFKGEAARWWSVAQWITSGTLWSVWIMQDAANIAIYLPRQLAPVQFIFFALVVFLGLGLIFFLKGDKIQEIVNEKSEVTDVRAATLIDFVYATVLIYKLTISTIPMSTTWVFIGLLGGRELGIRLREHTKKNRKKHIGAAFRMIFKDLALATIGLIVSIVLAMAVNESFRNEVLEFF